MTALDKQEKISEDLFKSDIYIQIEDFIQRMRNLELVVDKKDEMSDYLAIAMTEYEMKAKISDPLSKWVTANTCLLIINQALTHGIVKPGEGVVKKLKECSDMNIELTKELERVNIELIDAKNKIEELEQMSPHFTGDVE
jgi:hypothetical protein